MLLPQNQLSFKISILNYKLKNVKRASKVEVNCIVNKYIACDLSMTLLMISEKIEYKYQHAQSEFKKNLSKFVTSSSVACCCV